MNNNGVAKISTYLIGLVVIGMVFTAMLGLLGEANRESETFLNGTEETSQFNSLENKFGSFLDDVGNDNQQFKDAMNETQQEGSFGFLDILVNSGFSTLKNLWSSFTIVNLLLSDISNWGLGIPSWVGYGLISIIIILIAFGIYRFIFKVEG